MKKNNLNIRTICCLLILFSVIAFAGCKKDDDPSSTDKLSDKDFKLTAATIDPAVNVEGNMITNYYSILPACSKDNITRFAKAGTYTDNEGASKCSPTALQTTNGTWTWNGNETVLSMTDASGTRNLNIIKNDGTILSAYYSVTIDGSNYTYTVTYTKQ